MMEREPTNRELLDEFKSCCANDIGRGLLEPSAKTLAVEAKILARMGPDDGA